jgi:hypothetical protein
MTEADKRSRDQAKQEWDMRRFHRQPKEKKKKRRSSSDGEGEDGGSQSESDGGAGSPRTGSPGSAERSKSPKDKKKNEDIKKGLVKSESPKVTKFDKEESLRIKPVSKKFDIKIEAPFLKAERVRPNRNLQTTQRINYHTAMASPATNELVSSNTQDNSK